MREKFQTPVVVIRGTIAYVPSRRSIHWVPLISIPLTVDIKSHNRFHDSIILTNRLDGSIRPIIELMGSIAPNTQEKTYVLFTLDVKKELENTLTGLIFNEYKKLS